MLQEMSAIPQVFPDWSFGDYLGAIRVRSAIGRNHYTVKPGLYRIGNPDSNSEVFVTANYKLSFDHLRRSLRTLDGWILVLDTRGVNVWCAAGKGTFGTAELVKQIEASRLEERVSHRRLILPQLGAPGIAGHEVSEQTGFKVYYGPVRAKDIPSYLANRYRANKQMREVTFGFMDRLVLTPVEIVNWLKPLLALLLVFFLISGIHARGFSLELLREHGFNHILILGAAYVSGTFLTPVLLPWIPTPFFSGKGLIVGGVTFLCVQLLIAPDDHLLVTTGLLLVSLAISAFTAMNFTGATTYTSLSGVKKEMKVFVPVELVLATAGMVLVVAAKFFET